MKIRTFLMGLLAVGVLAVGARAQTRATNARTVGIAVALVDTLSRPEHRAEILRFSDPSRPDVILLRQDASAEALVAAIASYRISVARTPGRPGAVGRTAITELSSATAAAAPLRARATEMLAKVRRAPLAKVGNYGRGRWAQFEVRVGG